MVMKAAFQYADYDEVINGSNGYGVGLDAALIPVALFWSLVILLYNGYISGRASSFP